MLGKQGLIYKSTGFMAAFINVNCFTMVLDIFKLCLKKMRSILGKLSVFCLDAMFL
jgi:hypothetical protein